MSNPPPPPGSSSAPFPPLASAGASGSSGVGSASSSSNAALVAASGGAHGSAQPVGQTVYIHPGSGVKITTSNVVCTMSTGSKLDLMNIATQTRNSEYSPSKFAAVVLRIRSPKVTGLIFSSGKVVVTGAKSVQDAKLAARKFGAIIRKVSSPDAKTADLAIQNIVCSCDCKFAIRLESLALAHGKFSSYEPELFPGLIYRMASPKIVLLIFVSGKVVVTGAKDQQHSYEAFNKIYPVLLEFKKA